MPEVPAESGALDALARIESGEALPRRRWALVLLVIPLATVVYPPLYNHRHPALGGVPFFVWYQMAAVAFGGIVTGIVYALRREAS